MHVFITGVSSGLGLALAQKYLKEGNIVIGIGRKSEIQHQNYSFVKCDLASWQDVENLDINLPKMGDILLINNAGLIHPIQRISEQGKDFSGLIFQVNTIAPIQLIRKISQWCEKNNNSLTILNISSGAARRAIPSWANYCASKAALDMFSEAFQLEEIERGKATKIYSLAPGVIDTKMQVQIRNTKKEDFSSSTNFKDLHETKKLKKPEFVAEQIFDFLKSAELKNVICRLD